MSAPTPARRTSAPSRGGDPGHAARPAARGDAHPLAALHDAFGNLGVVQRLAEPGVQPKLEVGAPDDRYEREADAAAATIMRMPETAAPPPVGSAEPRLSRRAADDDKRKPKAAAPAPKPPAPKPPAPAPKTPAPKTPAGEEAVAPPPPSPKSGGKTTMHEEPRKRDEPAVAAKASPGAVPSVTPAAARTIQSQQGAGRSLSSADRSFFEPRFGRDLGGVRIHDDAAARDAARDVRAQAFTYGQDVYFGEGRYQPGTAAGRELLAHELAHTIQQRPGARVARRIQRAPVGAPAVGVVDWSQRLLTLPSVDVPRFRRGPYGQHLYDDGQTARPLKRDKDFAPDTRPDQRADWRRQIATTESERKLTETATRPAPAPPFSAGKKYKWRLPNNQVRSYTVTEAAREWRLPTWNRADRSMDFDVDHIRELQLADWPRASASWANTKDNWALLEHRANSLSGTRVRSAVAAATRAFIASNDPQALAARQEIPGIKATPRADEVPAQAARLRGLVDLVFTRARGVDFELPVTPNEFWTVADIEAGTHLRRIRVDSWSAPADAHKVEVFPLPDGGGSRLFDVGSSAIAASSRPATLLAPLTVTAANLTPGAAAVPPGTKIGTLTVRAAGAGALRPGEARTLDVLQLGDAARVGYVDTAQLRSVLSAAQIAGLSPITVDELGLGASGGLMARGRIQTDIAPLQGANLEWTLEGDVLSVTKDFTPREIHVPPPFTIDDVTVSLFTDLRTHRIGASGDVFFGIRDVGSGHIAAGVDNRTGFGFDGSFAFDTQLFTRAEIGVHYHDGRWSGDGVLEIGPGKVRGVRRAHLDASYADGHLHAAGNGEFDIPGVQSADAVLDYDAEHGLTVTATANLRQISAIRDGTVTVTLAQRPGGQGYRVTAHGSANATVAGITAQLTVDYDDGAFLAEAHVPVHLGLLDAQVDLGATNRPVGDDGRPLRDAPPLPNVVVFGGGSASIQITPWLRGTAGVHLLPNGEFAVTGQLTVPGVNLWDPIEAEPHHLPGPPPIHIPILGPVVLEIGGGLVFRYGIGAGVLSGSLGLDYNPSHEDQTHLYGDVNLHASAYAGIELDLFAGVGLDAVVASVTGRVTLGAEVRADAIADLGVHVDWRPGSGFSFDATIHGEVQPKLVFHLSASIVVSALFWDHEWTKELGHVEFGSGLQLGVTLPVHYQEGQPFAVDWGRLQFQHPDIDPLETAKRFIEEVV